MRIRQLDCRWDQDFFRPRLIQKYGMVHYTNKREPVVFFGMYGELAKLQAMNHTGLMVIVWSGSDSLRLHEVTGFVEWCKENEHRVFHIAHSHWIQTDLKYWGLKYIDRVVLPADLSVFKFEPEWGKSVYHYGAKQREWYYGTDIVKKLRKEWEKPKGKPNRFHVTCHGGYPTDQLIELYKDSFIGVRLTEHDNMALSAIEMGLMGRRTIFNGNIPGAINYSEKYDTYIPEIRQKSVHDKTGLIGEVRGLILQAWEKWGEGPDKLLAEEMREFVNDDMKWLETEYYDNISYSG